jgi:hypothetical protein
MSSNRIVRSQSRPRESRQRPTLGYLKLALVSCPIGLHAACSTAERIAFRQVNKATGNRLRQQLVDEETGVPAAPQDRGRGYEVANGHYIIVADEELDAIDIESTHTIEIDSGPPKSARKGRRRDSRGESGKAAVTRSTGKTTAPGRRA